MLIEEAVAEFLVALQADGCAPSTLKWYRQRLGQFVRAQRPSGPVEEVSRRDLRSYMAHLRSPERGLSPETVDGHIRAIKRFFRWLVEEGYLEKDPSSAVKRKKPDKQAPKAIKRETLDKLLKAAKRPRDTALLYFLAQTNCRAGEVEGLRCENLNIEGKWALVTGKGRHSRIVYLKPETRKTLRAWMEVHPGGDYVFCNLYTGEALTYWGLRGIIMRLKKRAGVDGKRCNLHSFRHFFAKEYLMDGGDMASLQDLMGHEDMSTTKRAYIYFTRRDLQEKHAKYAPSFEDESTQFD